MTEREFDWTDFDTYEKVEANISMPVDIKVPREEREYTDFPIQCALFDWFGAVWMLHHTILGRDYVVEDFSASEYKTGSAVAWQEPTIPELMMALRERIDANVESIEELDKRIQENIDKNGIRNDKLIVPIYKSDGYTIMLK